MSCDQDGGDMKQVHASIPWHEQTFYRSLAVRRDNIAWTWINFQLDEGGMIVLNLRNSHVSNVTSLSGINYDTLSLGNVLKVYIYDLKEWSISWKMIKRIVILQEFLLKGWRKLIGIGSNINVCI